MSKSLEDISLRERKKARIKHTILEVTLELIGHGTLDQLHVEEICKKAEISKVTFFKYFNRKEDILIYFMRVWCFHIAVEQAQSKLEGLKAIERIYKRAGDYGNRPGIMLSLIGFIANLSAPPTPVELSEAERLLHYPDTVGVLELEILNLPQMVNLQIEEARKKGEIKKSLKVDEVRRALIAVFYGGALVAHTEGEEPNSYYASHLKMLLKGIGG